MKVVIYTAIFGDYDILKAQPNFPNTEYVCFTDQKLRIQTGSSWRVVNVNATSEHPRLTAKRFKFTPDKFIVGADVTIWMDGSIVIVDPNFIQTCINSLQQYGIACMQHPVGKCIFQEAEGCCHMEKYKGLPILEQAAFYKAKGYPENNGLAACGIIVRDMSRKELPKIGQEWWVENQQWTYQDQISFPYVLWKNQYWYDRLNIDYLDRTKFILVNHNHPDR